MEAKTLKATSVAQLEKKLFECLKHGYRPTLSMVFCAPDHDFAALSKIFDISDIDLLGCTTAGEIVNDELHESSIVVLLMDVKKEHYKMFFKNNNSTIFKTGKSVRDFAESTFTNPSMIVATAGVLNDGEQIVAGLKMGDGREIPIFGGLAGDNLNVKDTYVFSRREYTNDGMLAIVFDGDKVELTGLATSGWEPLGSYHTITKAEGNVIYSINNEPALDYFIKFFGGCNH